MKLCNIYSTVNQYGLLPILLYRCFGNHNDNHFCCNVLKTAAQLRRKQNEYRIRIKQSKFHCKIQASFKTNVGLSLGLHTELTVNTILGDSWTCWKCLLICRLMSLFMDIGNEPIHWGGLLSWLNGEVGLDVHEGAESAFARGCGDRKAAKMHSRMTMHGNVNARL